MSRAEEIVDDDISGYDKSISVVRWEFRLITVLAQSQVFFKSLFYNITGVFLRQSNVNTIKDTNKTRWQLQATTNGFPLKLSRGPNIEQGIITLEI